MAEHDVTSSDKIVRPEVAEAKRVVIKVGTRVLTHPDGRLALTRLFRVVEVIGAMRRAGKEALLVTSGAVGLGRDALGLDRTPTDLAERQACAAIGQSRLMELYHQGFDRADLVAAQVLLTESDFDDRTRYLNLGNALDTLLRRGVVPIINENDVVSTDELAVTQRGERKVFGDNDRLSALVASELKCNLLVLCTDVPGVFDIDPRQSPDGRLIPKVSDVDDALIASIATPPTGDSGRGGMRSKVSAARVASRFGCNAIIVSGIEPMALAAAIRGEQVGTWFPAASDNLNARDRWIAFASRPRGRLHIDDGAVTAVIEQNASLLAIGVTGVDGDFVAGDVVELCGPDGDVVARGITRVDSSTVRSWKNSMSKTELRRYSALIRSNYLVAVSE
jgi:glutamate 5-kinase